MIENRGEVGEKSEASDQADGTNDIKRRTVLDGMGRFAYAAPALALLSRPKAAQADYGGPRRKKIRD